METKLASRRSDTAGLNFARWVRALGAGGGDRAQSIRWAKENGYPEIAAAMTSGNFGAGGALVPENFLGSEIIELLRPASAVRSLDPVLWPMEGGSATVPKLTGGATAAYKGEAKKATKSELSTGQVHLVTKQLITLVPLSNQLFRRSSPGAEQVIRDDAIGAIAKREDVAFIRGDGTQNTPTGLLNLPPAANLITANATVNLANVTTDLGKLILQLEAADVRMLRPGWIFAPRTKRYLMDVRDGNGGFAFRDEIRDGTLNGYPFAVTSQIPTNLGGGGDESEIYFADFADVVIGEEVSFRVDVSADASYHDGATVVSCFENDEMLLRVISEHDIGLRHDESVAIIEAVTWGA